MREFGVAVALAFLGYGLTIVLDLVAHESPLVGWMSLCLGAALLVAMVAGRPAPAPTLPAEPVRRGFQWGLALLGTLLCLGTLGYNLARRSELTTPEIALVAYGAAVLGSLPWLGRPLWRGATVMTAVAWSFPIVLAPLAIYAANGLLSSQAGAEAAAASPVVRWTLVVPTAALLELLGHDVDVRGNALLLVTPRGTLTLSVGLVCAGIYPTILFVSLFALYAWDRRPPWRSALLQGGVGLATLWMLNLVRMVVLAKVGIANGATALQQVHDQIGWILFAAFSGVFWWVVLRRSSQKVDAGPAVT